MTDINKVMSKHIRTAEAVEFENEDGEIDKIKMSPLRMEDYPEFWKIFEGLAETNPSSFDENGEMEPGEFFKVIDDKRIKILTDLIKKSIMRANEGADDEVVDSFVASNLFQLMPPFFDMNMPKVEE